MRPQNLYFYALACSPMESEDSRSRKNRLRYHQPAPPASFPYHLAQPPMPTNIQSASASPRDVHMRHAPAATLPHFHDTAWTRQAVSAATAFYPSPVDHRQSPTPSAPFANAGPPGIHFYPTPSQQASPIHYTNWHRGRQS